MWKLILMILATSTGGWADAKGGRVGNTVDGFICQQPKSVGEPAAGLYTADYLLTQGLSFSEITPASSRSAYAGHIEKVLQTLSPKLAKGFAEFNRLYLNTDYGERYVWEQPSFRLAHDREIFDLNGDGALSRMQKFEFEDIWDNCMKDGLPHHVIIVIKEDEKFSGRPSGKPLFKYNGKYLQRLRDNGPVHESFAVVHEWLWNHTDNIRANRRINRFLHSKKAAAMANADDRNSLNRFLQGMGFKWHEESTPSRPPVRPVEPVRPPAGSGNRAYHPSFKDAPFCQKSGFYGTSEMATILSKGQGSISVNNQTWPAFVLDQETMVLVRERVCQQSGNCTEWVESRERLKVNKALELSSPAHLALTQIGSTFNALTVGHVKSGHNLLCTGKGGGSIGSEGEVRCGVHPAGTLAIANNPQEVWLLGEVTYDCLRVKSQNITIENVNGNSRQIQISIYANFNSPLRRVQRVGYNTEKSRPNKINIGIRGR